MKIIEQDKILELIDSSKVNDKFIIDDIIAKALELKGLNLNEISTLLNIEDDSQLSQLFEAANKIKNEIYGKRLVLFAPLYISNFCSNNCLYCGFRVDNKSIDRSILTVDEIKEQTRAIIEQGHKRILLLMGENHKMTSIEFLVDSINAIYSVKDSKGSSIRRINIEIAPLTDDEFQILNKIPIGTYTVFQETYHKETYKKMHPSGPKSNYTWRLETMDRALSNGMQDIGIGALFGLFDYKFEVLAMIQHSQHLDSKYGIGPHTISIPRIKHAKDAPLTDNIPYPVSDRNFKKLIAVLRCAVPYTGMILSTREQASLRTDLYQLGISQISAGSKTNIGGYKQLSHSLELEDSGQFELNDCRSSGEVIKDVISRGYIPSFCTSCYRAGRVGQDFMDQAKPGLIKIYCQPNGLTTLKEYLVDYADEDTRHLGEMLIEKELDLIPNEHVRNITKKYIDKIEKGERDLYF